MREIVGNLIQANKMFNMIQKNDHIAIAVSGGKDSLVLSWGLKIFCDKLNKQFGFKTKIKAFMVDLGFKKINFSPLKKFFKKINVNFEILKSNISEILNAKKEKNKIQCSLCSKMKKAILIRELKNQKFNKIAFGHHADDAVETFFLNIFNEGRIATFSPVTYLDREKITMIRPMILIREKQIMAITKKYDLPILKNACPNERITQRTYIKNFLQNNVYKNKNWPNSLVNIYRSLFNGVQANLWFFDHKKFKNIWKEANKIKS